MIPWLIFAAEVLVTLAVTYYVKGKKQERLVLLGMTVLTTLVGALALVLEGGTSGWLRWFCWAVPIYCYARLDRVPKKRKR